MATQWYILRDRTPVPVQLAEAVQWQEEDPGRRFVARTGTGELGVSTVFLGASMGDSDAGPLLFETRIFGGHHHGKVEHTATWEAAEACHERMCELIALCIN